MVTKILPWSPNLLYVFDFAIASLAFHPFQTRLGMGEHQLLDEVSVNIGGDKIATNSRRRGIALPRGLRPDSLSILVEPGLNSDRAVLLLSSSSSFLGGGGNDGTVTYMAFQTQVMNVSALEGKKMRYGPETQVLSRLCSTGRIVPCGRSSRAHGVSGVFVAGASFSFDLRKDDHGGCFFFSYKRRRTHPCRLCTF